MVNNLAHKAGLGDSDHECITFTLDCYEEVKNTEERLNYYKSNYTTIRQRLKQINRIYELKDDFSTAYINFIKALETAMKGCIPKYKSAKKKKNIYLTQGAIRLKDLKNKLWRRYTRTKPTTIAQDTQK